MKSDSILSILKDGSSLLKQKTLSGNDYNLFQVIGDYRSELMHSAMIASILDPRGSHGQGSVFLKHFLDKINIRSFNPESAFVLCEKAIGDVIQTESGLQGGRIDIYLEDIAGNKIIIENKIDADDQDKQIERYYKYAHDAYILYLTIDGHKPTDKSAGCCSSYRCISYKDDILGWLNSCIADNGVPDYLRETLRNYVNLLTNSIIKTRNEMENLVNILTKDIDTVDAAFAISDCIESIKVKAQKNLWVSLKKALPEKLNPKYFSLYSKDDDLDKMIKTYYSYSETKESSKFYGISAPIGKKDGVDLSLALMVDNNLFYGIVADSPQGKSILLENSFIKDNLKTKSHPNNSWLESRLNRVIAWRYVCGQTDWRNGYNLRAFTNPLVKKLACSETPELTHILRDDFLNVYNEVIEGLQIK